MMNRRATVTPPVDQGANCVFVSSNFQPGNFQRLDQNLKRLKVRA